MADVNVILPAAGCGERFASSLPKQFVEVLGKPILCYTIEAFTRISWIKTVYVVVPNKWMEFTEQLIKRHNYNKVHLVVGEDTRHRSIFAGLRSLLQLEYCSKEDVVVVHDAVRPFLEEDFLKEVVEAAKTYKAAGAVRKLVSTVVKTNQSNFMECSLVRNEYRESHTPQAFQVHLLKEVYENCSQDDFVNGTECLNLVQKWSGVSPKLVDGPEYLWKVTHRKDLILMESYLRTDSRW